MSRKKRGNFRRNALSKAKEDLERCFKERFETLFLQKLKELEDE